MRDLLRDLLLFLFKPSVLHPWALRRAKHGRVDGLIVRIRPFTLLELPAAEVGLSSLLLRKLSPVGAWSSDLRKLHRLIAADGALFQAVQLSLEGLGSIEILPQDGEALPLFQLAQMRGDGLEAVNLQLDPFRLIEILVGNSLLLGLIHALKGIQGVLINTQLVLDARTPITSDARVHVYYVGDTGTYRPGATLEAPHKTGLIHGSIQIQGDLVRGQGTLGQLLTWLQVHFPHAVYGYHSYLVIEVVFVDIAFLEDDLEQ
jgi:hypothetical protein